MSTSGEEDAPPAAKAPAHGRPLALWAALLLAAVLRLHDIEARGLWWDEIVIVSNAVGSCLFDPLPTPPGGQFTPRDFWDQATLGNMRSAVLRQSSGNGILYQTALFAWIKVFGTRDAAVRGLSVLAGVLLVWLCHRLTLEFAGDEHDAAWVAAVVAVHPLLVRYSREAAPYALATLLATLGTLLFLRLWRRPQGSGWVAYGLCVGASLLTHYLAASVVVGHVLFAVVHIRRRDLWLRLIGAGGLAAVVLGAWIVGGGAEGFPVMARMDQLFQEQVRDPRRWGGGAFVWPATGRYVAAGVVQILLAVAAIDVQPLAVFLGVQLRFLFPLVLIPLLLCIPALWSCPLRSPRGLALQLMAVLALSGPAMALFMAWRSGHIVSLRALYMNFAAPYLAVLLGVGIAVARREARWRWLRPLPALQLAVLVASLDSIYRDVLWMRPPNRYVTLVQAVRRELRSGDTVVYPRWADARMANLYLAQDAVIDQRVEDGEEADDFLRAHFALPGHDGRIHWDGEFTEPIRIIGTEGERAVANPGIL